MQRSRFIVGLLLIAVAVLMLVFAKGSYSIAGVIALAVLGVIMVSISRKKPDRQI